MQSPFRLRKKKLENRIRQILSEIFLFEVEDDRIRKEYLSIIAVRLNNNFLYAKVYYSILHQENQKTIEELLKKMGGFIIGKLKPKLKTKTLPRLEFIYQEADESEAIINLIERTEKS